MKKNPNEAYLVLGAYLKRPEVAATDPAGLYYAFHEKQKALFLDMPASNNSHHSYPGGYAVHIAEVVGNAIRFHASIDEHAKSKVPLGELIIAAYVHDLDKLLWRYERDTEPPTQPQLGLARGKNIPLSQHETKSTISKKIDAFMSGKPIPPDHELPWHKRRPDLPHLDDSAIVLLLCHKHGLPALTEQQLEAISMHHGGWAPLAKAHPAVHLNAMAALLHAADIVSASVQNGDAPDAPLPPAT